MRECWLIADAAWWVGSFALFLCGACARADRSPPLPAVGKLELELGRMFRRQAAVLIATVDLLRITGREVTPLRDWLRYGQLPMHDWCRGFVRTLRAGKFQEVGKRV